MKKHFLQFMAISGLFFFTACNDSVTKENKAEPDSETHSTVDSSKKTTISIGPDGAGVKTKSTEVQASGSGVKVGTKDVNVDVKTGK